MESLVKHNIKEITVIIRSAGEKTEKSCFDIVLSELVSDEQIYILRELSFVDAQIKSINIGASTESEFVLFLDADVRLRRNAISIMLENAVKTDVLMYNFAILDRQLFAPTYGCHLYTQKFLNFAQEYAESSKGMQRPETYICNAVAKKYKKYIFQIPKIVGLHGYDQYLIDVYRTIFVRAVKFPKRRDYIFERIYSNYLSNVTSPNNVILLMGFLDGLRYSKKNDYAPLSKAFYIDNFERHMERNNFIESSDEEYMHDVDAEISNYQSDELYEENKVWLTPSGYASLKNSNLKTLIKRVYARFKD